MSRTDKSLRVTFRHEVRPDIYIGYAWATCWVAALVWAGFSAFKNGQIDPAYVIPLPIGTWHSRDPAGILYVETWATILVDALQSGFGIWGVILLLTGFWRAVTTHKAFISCFSLGGAFLGFAWFLPAWATALLKMLVEHYPVLAQ